LGGRSVPPFSRSFRAVETYITTRREGGKANATIDRELELLRRALRLAHVRQLLPSIPKMRVLTENNSRQGFLERLNLEAVVLRAWTSATDR
jgi:hypothetical protein